MPQPRYGRQSHRSAAKLPLILMVLFLGGLPAWGQASKPAPPPLALNFGFDTRVREVTLHNLLDLDSDTDLGAASDAHFFRVRHRIWAEAQHRSGVRLYSRFTTEWRKYITPWTCVADPEIVLDNLYLDVPRIPGTPLSLRIGRQDLIRGEGFILLEGGPNDGSRTIYQNAILLGADGQKLGLGATRLEAFAIRNLIRDELVLGSDTEMGLSNEDETAFGFYAKHTAPRWSPELYCIYKRAEYVHIRKNNTTEDLIPSGPNDVSYHTVGSRVTATLPYDVKLGAEGAYQMGTFEDPLTAADAGDHKAYGMYGWLERMVIFPFKPTLRIGALLLSGDDPDTDEAEAWRPVFSRWPKWSELYIYTLARERGRVAYWSNLTSVNVQVGVTILAKTKLTYAYHKLEAPYNPWPEEPPEFKKEFMGRGTRRGTLHIWKLTAKMGPRLAGHFLVERFNPGNFYAEDLDDAYFLRWEVMYRR